MALRIEAVTTLPAGFDVLLAESQATGFRFLARLKAESELASPPFLAPDAVLLAAFGAEGRLVGICGVYRDPFLCDPRIGRLRHLYVAAADRRSGVGRLLVDRAIEHARGRFEQLRLRANTDLAARFYLSLGFVSTTDSDSATHYCNLAERAVDV